MYESVTASIISELEKGVRPWTKGWKEGKSVRIPSNAATGRHYSGMNILLLWQQVMEKGYPSHGWMTFRQANDLKARVKKGEKSCTVVYTSFKPRDVDDGKGGTESKMVPMLKAYSVFNVAQLEGLPAIYNAEPEKLPDDVKLDGIRSMVQASGISVQYGSDIRASMMRVKAGLKDSGKSRSSFVARGNVAFSKRSRIFPAPHRFFIAT
ncbi:ArdC-like ssDNA-binding domain-containing protein [Bradyrhizobium sp. SYSU BS000235]|uniref:ArdC-like ssDNA-binding domain-containing protein n=1 Tax=Bradyrhizobium sp. SYSU BS000235 TaxID=3411332 RepID=UPI003C777A05